MRGTSEALVALDDLDPMLARVGEVADARQRDTTVASAADRLVAAVLGLGYLGVAAVWAAHAGGLGGRELAVSLALVGLYALAYRTEFEAASGAAVPTQPVLVALLFVAPVPLVPLLVLLGLLLGGSLELRGGSAVHQLMVRAASGWHCLGPVLVLWATDLRHPTLADWPLLALALGLQFAVDAAAAGLRGLALGVSWSGLVRALGFTFAVDALLAPLALAVVIAADAADAIGAVIPLVALPVALLHLLGVDRRQHLATAVSLGEALVTVRDEARVDPLTGLANRRAWDEALVTAARIQADDPGLVVTVVMADVDRLKVVNDTYGHEAGDELIRTVGRALRTAAPAGAVVARLGGDEFGVLVTTASPLDGDELLDEVRAALADRRLGDVEVSASLGVAACPSCPTVEDAARAADDAAVDDKRRRRVTRV